MSQQLYRIVESRWGARGREEFDAGYPWVTEREAKKTLRELNIKRPNTYSIQKKPKGG